MDQQASSTTLTMEQTGVPVGEEESTRQNWRHYYFNGIKQAFGYVELSPRSSSTGDGEDKGMGGRRRQRRGQRQRGEKKRKGRGGGRVGDGGGTLVLSGLGILALSAGLGYLLTSSSSWFPR